MLPQLLTSEQVAEWLQIPTASLYAQRYRREPPGSLAIRVGRHLRWDRARLEQWLDQLHRTQ